MLDLLGAAHVAGDRLHRGADLLRHFVERFLVASADYYARTFADIGGGDSASDATAGAGDEGDCVA
jgi:hypothetical protein